MEVAFQSGFASALLDVVFNKVTDGMVRELKKFKKVDEAVINLKTSVIEAQTLLDRMDTIHFQGCIGLVLKNRVDTLTTLCYDAEDVMDKIALMISKGNSGSSKNIWGPFDSISRNPTSWNIPSCISKLQKKLDGILKELKDLTTEHRDLRSEVLLHGNDNHKESRDEQVSLVGRDNDVNEIIQKLIGKHSNKGVSIVGMNGLGKTVLARTIVGDKRIMNEFPSTEWVRFSNGCFKKDEVGLGNEEDRQNKLIVLDNLLKLKRGDWDAFLSHKIFRGIGKIKFLITSTNSRISELTGTCNYHLKSLSDDDCKELIVQKACFHNQNLSGPWFSHVAGELAKKCEGLPLIARIIGIDLGTSNKDRWNDLLEEDLWRMQVFREEILPVLNSPYKNMKSYMKRCLAYFSLFPQDYGFNMDDLVQLWAAEGFIEQSNDSSSLEVITRNCIDDFQERSIILFSEDASQVGCSKYELHKFTQKYAQVVASKTCLKLAESEATLSSFDKVTRHLSLLCNNIDPSVWEKMRKLKRLRTILSLYDYRIGQLVKIPHHFFKSLERLRVLVLRGIAIVELPDSIDRLKHLRYLDVADTFLTNLPDKVSTLCTLKFLKFKNTELPHLPKDFQKLTSLLRLDWDVSGIARFGLPPHIGELSRLQTLPLFSIGDEEKGFSITELQNMNCLQGFIRIENLELVKNGEKARAAMLHNKPFIRIIELQWNTASNKAVAEDVLMGLKPHLHIRELKIKNYGGDSFPEWMCSPFPTLKKIHLHKCNSCTELPALGKLQALETLIFQEMSSLVSVDHLFCGTLINGVCGYFPSLKLLEFNDMPKLQEWTRLMADDLQQLCILRFVDCPVLKFFPSLENISALEDLQIRRCDAMESLPCFPASLKSLTIRESSKLEAHCSSEGREWPKINCVPYVEIGENLIQTSAVSNNPSTSSSPSLPS